MQALRCLLVSILVLVWAVDAQNTTLNEALNLIQTMPKCGSSCLLSGIANSTCEASDIPCTCNNQNLTDVVTACVKQSCTVKQSLTTKNVTETICQRPIRDGRKAGERSVIIGLAFSLAAFALRICSKISSPCGGNNRWSHTLWWDDAVMAFAMVMVLLVTYGAVPLNRNGLATDVWTVPFAHITRMLKIFYWVEDGYLIALPAVKISLLITYLRVFPAEGFRKACFAVIALNVAYTITFVLISIFQCWPIKLAWEHWHKEMPGRCNNINAQIWAAAAGNMLLDILTLGLPMPLLWKIQLNIRKKFWLMLMFGVGFFVTIVSIVRLRVLVLFGDSDNLTWDYTSVGYWSTVELHTSVVCACMPSIRNLLRKSMPYVMGVSTGRTGGASNPTGQSTGVSGFTVTTDGVTTKFPRRSVMVRSIESDEENIITLDDMHYSSHNKTPPLPPDDELRYNSRNKTPPLPPDDDLPYNSHVKSPSLPSDENVHYHSQDNIDPLPRGP